MNDQNLHDLYLNALHELNHEKLRREAFERDLAAQVKITDSFAKNVLDIGYEARDLASEVKRLKAEVELWKLRSDNWQKFCQATKAEVERLTSTIGAQLVELDDLRAKLRS